MPGYEGHLIAPFTEGMDKKLEPWLTPEKAFTELFNSYIRGGVIKERRGTTLFGRLGLIVEGETGFTNPTGNQFTKTLVQIPIPHSLKVYDAGGTMIAWDDGFGVFTGDATGTVVYSTKAVDLTFTGAKSGTITAEYHYYATASERTVRGVHFFNKDLGANQLLASDKKRLNVWNSTQKYFDNVASGTAVTNEAYATGGGTPGPYTHTASNLPVVPFTVRIFEAVTGYVLYDNGNGVFIETKESSGSDGSGTGTINYTTGAMSVTFAGNVAANPIKVDYRHVNTPVYDQWNTTNLQWGENWAAAGSDLYWMCDDATNIHVYNGTYAIDITPRLILDSAGTLLTSAKCMVLFEGRPIFFNTIEGGIRYSDRMCSPALGNSLTVDAWRRDVAGYGSRNDALNGQEIITAFPLRKLVVVFFEYSIGIVSYTSNPAQPYAWDILSAPIEANSTFGFWNLADFGAAVGKYEVTACDGIRAMKANEKLPDFTFDIDYDNINLCYGFVVQSKKQAWLAYPSRDNDGEVDKVLVFNYEDNVISVYDFYKRAGIEVRCLEQYIKDSDVTYTDLNNATYWDDVKTVIDARGTKAYYSDYGNYTYEELSDQAGSAILLAGSTAGYVYSVDDDNATTDNGAPYNFNIVTKEFNPYADAGKKVGLGYIDFLVTGYDDCQVEVKFYLGFGADYSGTLSKIFSCDGTGKKVWKRVFCNASAPVISYSLAHPEPSESQDLSFELHLHKPYFKSGDNLI